VIVGQWCFAYRWAVRTMIVGDIGGHSSWVNDPGMLADLVITDRTLVGQFLKRAHRIMMTPNRAVYVQSYRGVPYRMTFVPAFPGLAGSIWELVRVTRR